MPLPLLAILGLIGAGTTAAGAAVGAARRAGKARNPLEDDLNAQVVDKGPDGAFLSVLEALGRPGHIVNNLAVGNLEGAGRQGVDLLGDVVDSVLPGDWFPHISRRMDKPGFSDVIGGMDPGLAKTAVDIAGGIASDPLNLIPGAAVAKGIGKGAGLVKAGVNKLPEPLAQGAKDFALGTKETLGWLNPVEPVKRGLAAATALRGRATRTGFEEAARVIGGLSPQLRTLVGQTIHNVRKGDDGKFALIKEDIGRRAGAIEPIDQQLATLRARVAEHPDYQALEDAAKARVDQAIEGSIRLAHTQYLDDLKHGALANPVQYTDPTGKTFMRDELEEMYRQERGIADPLRRQGERLAGEVGRLDQQTIAANRIANAIDDPLRGEFRRQTKRDQALSGKQADVEDELARIDPGEFDAFLRGRGLTARDVDVSSASPRNYLQRLFEFPDDAEFRGRGALADAQKSRKLKDDASLARFLNEHPDVGFEFDAYKSLLARSQQQGRMLQKAAIAKQILGDRFENLVDGVYRVGDDGVRTYDKSVNAAVDEAIEVMTKTDAESARALANAYRGMEARGPVLDLLAKANRFFKPAAVYGVVLPKLGSIVRNDLGTTWQIGTEQGLKAAGRNLARSPRRLWDAINDGTVRAFGLKRVAPGDITRDIGLIEDAYKAARGAEGGVAMHLRALGRDDLAAAAEHGVLDGFVSKEEILNKTVKDSWWKRKFFDLYDAPGEVFQGVEQRARLANFLEQVRNKVDPAAAAQKVRDSLLDYSVSSSKNRTLRDLIPFAAFLTGSVRQQSKLFARQPGLAGGLSRALEQDPDQQVYPYMEGKLNIPIGKDAQGNAQFISGLGLPFEALNAVPNPSADLAAFGRQVQQDLVGSSQPLLKSAFATVSGEDPYFGTPFGSYEKAPIVGNAGDAGRFYNKLAGTGLIQPLDTPVRLLDKVLDERRTAGTKSLDLLTGANVVSVDQDRALQQRLQEELAQRPDVAQYRGFYDRSGDEETAELLRAYSAAKARVKAKREAQEAAADPGTL